MVSRYRLDRKRKKEWYDKKKYYVCKRIHLNESSEESERKKEKKAESNKIYYQQTSDIRKIKRKRRYKEINGLEKESRRLRYLKNIELFKMKYQLSHEKQKVLKEKYYANSAPKKLAEKERYRKNPEKKKAYEKEKYKKNPQLKKYSEMKRYKKNPEPKKIGEKKRYKKNPEPKKIGEKKRYKKNPEPKKIGEKKRYKNNPEPKKIAEKKRYLKNPEPKKIAEKKKYFQNPESKKIVERLKYCENPHKKIFQYKEKYNILIRRQKNWMKFKSKLSRLNESSVRPLITEDNHLRTFNCLAKKGSLDDRKINAFSLKWINQESYKRKLIKSIKKVSYGQKSVEAKSVIKWCFYAHKMLKRDFTNKFSGLKDKCTSLFNSSKSKCNNEQFDILFGRSLHTTYSEPYYFDYCYNVFSNRKKKIVINENHVATNIFDDFTVHEKKNKLCTWKCNEDICDIKTDYFIERIKKLYNCVSKLKMFNALKFFMKINECPVSTPDKKHTAKCYIKGGCDSNLFFLKYIGPHFPLIRYIIRLFYTLKKNASKLEKISKAFKTEDFKYLKKLADETSNKANSFQHSKLSDKTIVESDIINRHIEAFSSLEKRCSDMPTHPCISCDKLFFKRQIRILANLRKPIKNEWWEVLVERKKNEVKHGKICILCLENFRKNKMPSTCILNALDFGETPKEIHGLNSYEKILIQRAKAFQVVTRMEIVGKKRVSLHSKIQKVKGRTFHLPLPIEETLKKLPRPEEPINQNHELNILVRGAATKSKIIWESLVDVNKVYAALKLLKSKNEFYRDIKLPNEPTQLLNFDHNTAIHKFECKNRHQSNNQKKSARGLLTQVTEENWDEAYKEFTILSLNETRINYSATAMFQMLKVKEEPIDFNNKNIDVLCFPDLFHLGKFGQFHERNLKLSSAEYIKSRLMSRYSQFRLNQQYLFFLLHDANIRQLRQGIFHKLNVSNIKERLTADACLKNLSDCNLEGNLTTVFSKLRNTSQYWIKPRNDLTCMVYHYGPATWFLTMSPSEWNWVDLRDFLIEVNINMNGIEKKSTTELIAMDPVSVSRFIDNKFHAMLEFILSNDKPLGKVVHYFYRREYQGRGLQHFHLLLWVENAPILGESSNEEVAKFISKYLTCALPIPSLCPVLYNRVIKYQAHSHNSYCLRSKKTKTGFCKVCRFGFPRPVTDFLELHDVVEAVVSRKTLKSKGRLYDLKRNIREQYINDYNPTILLAWDGNIDLQYIGEKTTILNWYITKYTTKSENCHTLEMFNDVNSTKSLSSRLFSLGIRLLNSRECGALEASDTLLGIPLYGTDTGTTIRWLDVNMQRKRRLLPIEKIKGLDSESTNLFYENFVDDYYPNRPTELEEVSLYEFSRWYDVKSLPLKKNTECYRMENKKYLTKRNRPYLINHYKFSFHQNTEKYFYALLILFMPWRNTKELKGNSNTFSESFEKYKDRLLDAVTYDKKLQEIREAVENTNNLIQTKKFKLENETMEGNEGPEAGIAFTVCEAEDAMKDMKIISKNNINKLDNDVVNIDEMVEKLNADQKRVFDFVINVINNKVENCQILRHFVSGVGGTGKSYLIHTLRAWVKNALPNGIVSVSAPTGLSAYNVSGITIFRQFQLPVEHGHTPKYRPLSDEVLKLMREELKDVVLYIIDEISMVSNLTLLYIHLRLSEIFTTNDTDNGWFGKKHILLFGDLLQLPPVHEDSPYLEISRDKIAKYIGSLMIINIWVELFTYDELTINMRQAEDKEYAQILDRVRIGSINSEDFLTLKNRMIPLISNNPLEMLKDLGNYIENMPFETVCLCAVGYQCDQLNKEMLSRLKENEIPLIAKDSIDCKAYIRNKVNKLLKQYQSDCTRTAGMEKNIIIKIGAKVMLRRNIDLSKGLVNSAIGIVTGIKRSTDNLEEIERVQIKFTNGLLHDLERVTTKFEIMDKCYVFRKQFPITVSYGITIHKSQGLTFKNAVMDIGETIFSCGQIYVALSRVTSLKGVHLINFSPLNIKAQKSAKNEYNRLRSKYKPNIPLVEENNFSHKMYQKDRKWWYAREVNIIIDSETEVKKDTTNNIISGFTNEDNVSCYANSVIQCLYNCEDVKSLIKNNFSIFSSLRKNLSNYEVGHTGNTKEIRVSVGDVYEQQEQQDAIQFMEDLLNKCKDLKSLFDFTVRETSICQKCNYTRSKNECDLILRVPILRNLKYIPDMISNSYGHWGSYLEEYTCERCGNRGLVRQKYEITSASKYIILQFMIFDNALNKLNFNISGVPRTKLKIADSIYFPISAIFHHGKSIHNGHYVAYLKNRTKWFCTNDALISEKRWPFNGKNLYALIMKK